MKSSPSLFRFLLVLSSLCSVPAAKAATFNVSGTTLQLNLTVANESVAITAGAANYNFVLTGGTWSGTDSADVTGNGTASLSAVKASFAAVTVDDSSTGNGANFNDSGANTYTANFTITLDSATPGTSTFSGTTAFTGSNALSLQSGVILGNSGSIVSTVNGNLTLLGNMQTPGQTGNLFGIFLNNTDVTVSGSGNLTIKGKSGISTSTVAGVKFFAGTVVTGGIAGTTVTVEGYGAASSIRNYGVNLVDAGTTITSAGGNVVVAGTGGSSTTGENKGVLMEAGTAIFATGSGSITLTGNGGGNGGTQNAGVEMLTGTQIASANGSVSITGTGTGGGGATGSGNRGVFVAGSIKSTGSGTVNVTGTGGPGSGGDNQGVLLERNGTGTAQEISSGVGDVTITGSAGGGTGSLGIKVNSVSAAPATLAAGSPGTLRLITDSISLVTSAVISASSVTVAPKTAGKNMDIGSTSDTTANTLALSQAELNTITASSLTFGDANTASINLSANVTRPANTSTGFTASTISTNGNTLSGGTLYQTTAGQPDISVTPLAPFGVVSQGGSKDLSITLSSTGFTDLTGISLSGVSGTDFSVTTSPASTVAAGSSSTFTLRFLPTSFGAKTASLQIASNDPDENPVVISLSGFGGSPAGLSGTRSVGPTGDYTSITQAIPDIQAGGLGGPLVLELQPAYVSTVETFPLTFPALNGASATNTLTVRPQTGATGLSISSANTTAATMDLNGAQFVTFDGRPGGTGTAKELTIANTSTSGVALRFINEASNNRIKFVTLTGVNTSATSGTVLFSTTTGANGNDNNTLDTCDIRDGATTPTNGILSSGTTTTTAQANSGNTVSNSNIFNFYASTAVRTSGVRLEAGSSDWTITGNSFYQTASRAPVAEFVIPVYLNTTAGGNFLVSGNFIGGTEPQAGGTPWTVSATTAAYQFLGIWMSVSTSSPTSIQGNTVRNFTWRTSGSQTSGIWIGIDVSAGSVNVGTVNGNVIGSSTGTDSVSVTTSGSGGTVNGLNTNSTGTVTIANNTVGSITAHGSATSVSASINGIRITAGTNVVSGNTIGSTTTANSLNAATASNSATGQQVTGIVSTSSTSASITGNTVANLNNNYASSATTGQIRGIVTSAGVNTITGNTVRNLSTTSLNSGSTVTATTGQSVVGIADISTTAGQTVSQNTVHSLANTAASANVSVTGIYYAGATSGTNVIARNFVHSLAVSSSNASSQLKGMQFVAGTFTAQNNLVRVGLDANGASTGNSVSVFGIWDNGTTAGRNFYHNSVYVGGTQTGTPSTIAFNSVGVSNARTFQNNIFVNARSNNPVSLLGRHYAVFYSGTSVNPTGLTAGGNLFFAPNTGAGGVLGSFTGADRTTLAAWQAATGQDATSAVADPKFIAPDGDASAVDLHLQASNPAESGGIPLTDSVTGTVVTVADDFDGEPRSTLAPADVGADAGGFTLSPGDLFAPAIRYPLLTSGSTANRQLTGWSTMGDNLSGVFGARLYFKKSTDADVFGGNAADDNGWKYVNGTPQGGGSSSFSFMLDYSIIRGGSVSIGDTIQYFVVAQDGAGNLGSSPAGATASGAPAVQTVNGHGAVNSFSIVASISGTKTVGTGGDYASLSGTGGLFTALNSAVLSGNLEVIITSDTTESSSFTLNPLNSNDYPPSTLTIRPDGPTMRTITGSGSNGLIRLVGADGVTIDGRSGGGGRYLTFRNTSTTNTASTILFQNDSSNNTVRNCVVEGAMTGNSLGVIGFSIGTVTGNNNNLITECRVRDLSTATGVPMNLIGSTGSATFPNSNNTISNNECFNFTGTGIHVGLTGNSSWTVTGNDIYDVNQQTGAAGITMNAAGTNFVTQNYLHDLQSSGTTVVGIGVNSAGNTTVARNRIVLNSSNAANNNFIGINNNGVAGQTLTVINNQITIIPTLTLGALVRGIIDNSPAGCSSGFFHNTIVIGGTGSGASNTHALIRQNPGTFVARNNVFLNLRTGGTGNHFAMGNWNANAFTVSHNVYAGTGATAANFMDFGNGSTTPVSYATWQTSTGDPSPSAANPGGNYSTAMFVDATTGDLHLVPGGNVLVNAAGTPIASVTTDFDGDTRSASTPNIGADEIPLPDIAVEAAATVADGGSVSFGAITVGSSSNALTFTITNPGTADLTNLSISGATSEFTVSALSGTSVPVGSGSVTFTVAFTPAASGPRSATLQIASNVPGAKNPYDITVTGTGQTIFEAWAATNGVSTNPTANGGANLQAFAFGYPPGATGALVLNGTLAAGGTIGQTGTPITLFQPSGSGVDFRALFVRRKDHVAAGLTYTPQFSADMTTWANSAAVPVVLADDGTHQIVSVPYPPFIGGKKARFFRISVSIAP